MEDEDVVRELVRRVLEQSGYTVLEASRRREALRLAREHGGRIDLLITDVVMPGETSGPQLVDTMLLLHPGIKVLYMSGYTDRFVVNHGVPSGAVHFLQKPFGPDMLARKVREVLDAPTGGGETTARP